MFITRSVLSASWKINHIANHIVLQRVCICSSPPTGDELESVLSACGSAGINSNPKPTEGCTYQFSKDLYLGSADPFTTSTPASSAQRTGPEFGGGELVMAPRAEPKRVPCSGTVGAALKHGSPCNCPSSQRLQQEARMCNSSVGSVASTQQNLLRARITA